MTQATTHFSTISRVIVSVSDQDRSIAFYVGTLGFEKTADTPFGDGDRWVEVSTPEGGDVDRAGEPAWDSGHRHDDGHQPADGRRRRRP